MAYLDPVPPDQSSLAYVCTEAPFIHLFILSGPVNPESSVSVVHTVGGRLLWVMEAALSHILNPQ